MALIAPSATPPNSENLVQTQGIGRPRVLLIIPPLTQLNTPYPSTAYLTGFLRSRGYETFQADLGIELVLSLFSKKGLQEVFETIRPQSDNLPGEARQMLALEQAYVHSIDEVVAFLQGRDPSLATRICQGRFLPQGPRFARLLDSDKRSGTLSTLDQAKHLATLYLEDIADLIQATVAPQFALSRYAEHVGTSASSFDQVLQSLSATPSLTDRLMLEALARHMTAVRASLVGLTVPFPGNLYGAFRIAQWLKATDPTVTVALGGGYANTELRRLQDPRVFNYVDFVTLDDGERPLLCLAEYLSSRRSVTSLCRTYFRQQNSVVFTSAASESDFSIQEIGTPTYDGLPLDRYLSILDTTNAMHRLWSDGHWNKLTVAHGCYWKRCTFCDVGLDYIGNYEAAATEVLLGRIETLIQETGRRGFHFVDEAAPPASLKSLALRLLEKGLTISWWGNIRFEEAFTPDLCRLLAASGCIAVSAGLEVASDRLLAKMDKGITVDQTVRVASAFRQAGVLIHAYLMYGFPSETIQETVDSLERVRQLFAADLIQSAFWHKFVATAHSPIGLDPGRHGIGILGPAFQGFAENDLVHEDRSARVPDWLGLGLRTALSAYMERQGFERPVHRWFTHRAPVTTVPRDWIARAVKPSKPAGRSLADHNRQLVWIGGQPVIEQTDRQRCTVILPNETEDRRIRLDKPQAQWLLELIAAANTRNKQSPPAYRRLAEMRETYPFGGPSAFDSWSRKSAWRTVKQAGLLLV
ncbi:Radical SAM protein [Nitrospira tepida]|uniref:Radical SAM protein n=1 Tax=Nitrospira tepida TaxID=2973512 RepID=A0AA86MZR1_9BACT|nr:Radical SAM protein [Nitrospira tepida]